MRLVDVNILIYAYRAESNRHDGYRRWIEDLLEGDAAYGMSDVALAGFLRLVTNHRAFRPPSPLEDAISFADQIWRHPNCIHVHPGERHWGIFTGLCRTTGAKGKLIPDAWFAALAIESGSEWVTTDRDFARFPGLRWRHPLDG
ncbi:MAG: type II toxin-antitoxin system VapC family toxin [Acidimicrobiales bacterium]